MTDTDFQAFRTGMERTAAAYGKALDSTLTSTYFGDLEAYPLQAVLAALDKARQTGKFFPRVATLRELCSTHSQVMVATDIPSWVDHDQERYFCTSCDDTGFVRRLECLGNGGCHIPNCGREGHPSDPHPYTRMCSCRATNPILRRQRELLTQRTAKVEA